MQLEEMRHASFFLFLSLTVFVSFSLSILKCQRRGHFFWPQRNTATKIKWKPEPNIGELPNLVGD